MCIRDRFRIVKQSLFQKSLKNPHTVFLSNPVSKFPCQSSLPTSGSLSFLKIPTLASLDLVRSLVISSYKTITSGYICFIKALHKANVVGISTKREKHSERDC